MQVAASRQHLLERESELAVLHAACRRTAAGTGQVIAIEGPAGVGKTALLDEARAAALDEALEVLAASGTELEGELAFGVVRQLLEPRLRALAPDERGALLQGAAALAAPVVMEPKPAQTHPDSLHASLHGLYWLTADLAARKPLLLAVDDAHWADRPSLRWLAYLGRRLAGVPVLLLIAHRAAEPGASNALLERVLEETGCRRLTPQPLTGRAVERWLTGRYRRPPPPSFVAQCRAVTGGNPFLLGELVASLEADGIAPGAAPDALLGGVGPASVARSVLARLAPLGPDATRFAEATAVLSADARLERVATVARLPLDRAGELADELAAAGIVTTGERLEFRHPVLRSAIYEQMPSTRRALTHLAAAERLVADGEAAERAAAHIMLSPPGGPSWIVHSLRAAAASAVGRGTPDVAVPLLRRAIAEARDDRADVLLELATAECTVQDPAAAAHAQEAMSSMTGPERRVQAALVAGRALTYLHRFEDAAEVLAVAEEGVPAHDRVSALECQAQALVVRTWQRGIPGLGERLTALGVDELSGDTAGERLLLALRVMERILSAEERNRTLAPARRLLARNDISPAEDEQTLIILARCLMMGDAFGDAHRAFTAAIDAGRAYGGVLTVALGLTMRAEVELRRGHVLAAEADARQALAMAAEYEAGLWLAPSIGTLVHVLLCREPPSAAVELLDRHQAEAEQERGYPSRILQEARAHLLMATGRWRSAVTELRSCGQGQREWGERNPAGVPWRSSLALALAALDQREEAARLAEEELVLARRFGAPRAIGIAERALALTRHGDDRIAGLRAAARTLAASDAPLEYARVMLDLGAALRRAGRRVEARETLATALDRANQCGATRLVERARSELVTAGARPRRERLSGPDALTASERRVAEMAAAGLSNREIAQALFVTTKTVEMHLGRTYSKLGIHHREELGGMLAEVTAGVAGSRR